MVEDDPLSRLTPDEQFHQRFMREIAEGMADTPYVLKGGTALLLARGLDRHSVDMDFDSGRKLNLTKRIHEAAERAGASIESLHVAKDTDTTQRYKIHYRGEAGSQFLKVETSFRTEPEPEAVEMVNGIRTYKVDRIFDLKLDALENRKSGRDLFDIAEMVDKHGSQLRPDQINRLREMTADWDRVAGEHQEAFSQDPVLQGRSALDTVVKLIGGIERSRSEPQRDANSEAAALSRQIADKLPDGPDKDAAERAAKQLERDSRNRTNRNGPEIDRDRD